MLPNEKTIIDSFSGKLAFLSNFYPATIAFNDKIFPTSEHLYQWAKTTDEKEKEAIRLAPTPGKAKRIGRKCTLRPDWDERKTIVMKTIVRWKFKQNPNLAQKLLETGDAILVEGNNWHDNFWGSCRCEKCASIQGQNELGQILIAIREEIFVRGKL